MNRLILAIRAVSSYLDALADNLSAWSYPVK